MATSGHQKPMKICIIGAGMGGLTCALALAKNGFEDIHVYETASNLGFVGAGIQLAPNMSRILDRLGVWGDIEREAVLCKETSIRDGATDTELAHVELDEIKQLYGYPHMVGHRASLAGGLYEGCKREPSIKFHFSTSITSISSWEPNPTFTTIPRHGEPYEVSCDVLLAADGVKSSTRQQMLKLLNHDADVQDTDQAAYRILLKREEIEHDPELLELIESERVTRWIGARRHIIAYPISNNRIYNISTTQPDTNFAAAPSETYTTKGSKPAMLGVFADFCPKIQRMLSLVPDGEVCEWKLRVHAPLPTWIMGHVALVGDACHPTLPHLAQGAAQAIEDAAVLGVLLGKVREGRAGVGEVLRLYEEVRKERAEMLVEWAADSARELHLGSGKAKEERDKVFEELKKKGGRARVPDKWADKDVQKVVYGVDIVGVAEEEFEKRFGGL
ncbi:related to salicylate hydroxylase [Phialocephala subalpina]|uniref:Related to salicylate hydroxylase n=1 Tax=Phialocephala subalpina TaxID=576137 RepID=A0A1L7XQV7_9HELO|nr:related to salicylate hydroxylase [Phialocephala subalpina]